MTGLVAVRPTPAASSRLRFWADGSIQCLALIVAGVAVLLAPVAHAHMPARFLLDSWHIQSVMHGNVSEAPRNSFNTVAAVYRSVGLGTSESLVGLVAILLFALAVFLATPFTEVSQYGIAAGFIYLFGFLCALAYLAQYSKEILTLSLVIIFLAKPNKKSSEFVFVGACLVYAAYIREYWFIVVALYLVWRVLLPRIRSWLALAALVLGVYIVLQIGSDVFAHQPLGAIRSQLNEYRSTGQVESLISSPIPMDGVVAGPAAVLMLVLLMVPIPLALQGGLFHGVSAIVISALCICAVVGFVQARRRLRSAAGTTRDYLMLRGASLLLAFVMVQVVFEPDYGSYLKHLTPMIPVFLTVVPIRQSRGRCEVSSGAAGNADSGSALADSAILDRGKG